MININLMASHSYSQDFRKTSHLLHDYFEQTLVSHTGKYLNHGFVKKKKINKIKI